MITVQWIVFVLAWAKSKPALRVAVPALLIIRFCELARAADFIW